MKALRAKFFGIVQGVFFRKQVKEIAQALEVRGWVMNSDDGSVEAHFEGEHEAIQKALMLCQTLPLPVEVKKVEHKELPYSGKYQDFSIRY